jgi:hypothetical protein
MTELPESRAESTTVTGQPRNDGPYDPPSRLFQVTAWVGIVGGVVFVVAVIFFAGLFLGWSSGGYGDDDGRSACEMSSGGMTGRCPMMGPDGMIGPGEMGPGGMTGRCPMMGAGGMMGPGQLTPGGMMGPSPSPTTTAPGTPRP